MDKTGRITRVEVSYGFEQSDHAAVLVEMHINEDIEVGPGHRGLYGRASIIKILLDFW